MKETKLFFPCGDLSLEGVLSVPDGRGPFAAVVVCHPHSLYGGAMDNNVVLAICNTLVEKGMASLRFNFRGVGESEGNFGKGIGEQEDIRAAISTVRVAEGIDMDKIGLAGYSFGAGVALAVAPEDERVKAVAAVSPLVPQPTLNLLRRCFKPKYFICGSQDSSITLGDFQRIAYELPQPTETEVISGADHYWWGREGQVAERVADFFIRTLLKA